MIPVFSQAPYDQPFVVSPQSGEVPKDELGEILRHYAAYRLNTENFDEVISYSNQLKTLGEQIKNQRFVAYANTYLGQAYLMKNETGLALEHMQMALEQAISISNDSLLCSVYNGLGLFAVNVHSDLNGALTYFFLGLEAAKRSSFKRLYNILLLNISGIYYLREDPTGIDYVKECYNYGHSVSDPFLVLWGAFLSCDMYILMGDYQEAFKYIQEAEFILQNNVYHDMVIFYNLYGRIMLGMGKPALAEEYFLKGIDNTEKAKATSIANLYLNYGKLLISQQRYHEALPYLEQGIELSRNSNNRVFMKQLYAGISECYQGMRNYQDALKYHRMFYEHAESLFNEESERAIQQLRIQFDAERIENDARQARLKLILETRKKQYLVIILMMVVGLAVYLYFIYNKKNRLYHSLIIRNKSALKKESELKAQLALLRAENSFACEKYSVSSLTDDKKEDLFQRIEALMNDEQLFRDPHLTKEKMADKLGTNRTYLSQVINEKTTLNVTQYINNFRIDEAVRQLSDARDDTPLKSLAGELGFNSTSTFYKVFQSSVGMTPAHYRKKAREIFS